MRVGAGRARAPGRAARAHCGGRRPAFQILQDVRMRKRKKGEREGSPQAGYYEPHLNPPCVSVAVAMGVMPATIPTLPAMAAAVPRTVLATVIPSSAEWPAPLSAGVAAITSSSATAVPTTAAAATASQGLVAVNPSGATGATAVPAAVASPAVVGHLLGEGIAPLPPKLVKKITSLEFVEMADLLPEAWLLEETAMEAQLRR